jgi:hypothetical protein
MKNRLPIWDLVERAQAEVACRILEGALLERQYALRKDAKKEQSLLPERTPKRSYYRSERSDAIYFASVRQPRFSSCPPAEIKGRIPRHGGRLVLVNH